MTSSRRFRARPHAVPYLLAWIPVMVMGYHLRSTLLTVNGGGFEYMAQALSLTGEHALSLGQRLSSFREDLLVGGLLVPLALCLVLRPLSAGLRLLVTLLVTLPTMLVLFIELKCFWEVGAFVPFTVLIAGIKDTGQDLLPEYLKVSSALKLLLLWSGSVGLALVAWQCDRRQLEVHRLRWVGPAVAMVVLLLTAAAWLVPALASPYQSSAIAAATHVFFDRAQPSAAGSLRYPVHPDSLMRIYQQLSRAPLPNRASAFNGRAAGYDVLLVILETAPSAVLNVAIPESLPPTLRALATHAFVATQHHSTYPYTTRAVFSIFTSWYPGNGTYDVTKRLEAEGKGVVLPGIVRSASRAGYLTALFGPDPLDNFEHDQSRFQALGFDSLFTPHEDSLQPTPSGDGSAGASRRERTMARDRAALALLKQRIQRSVATNQRYFFSFLPQYSHAPWPDVTVTSSQAQVFASGRTLFHEVDGWLGEIVSELRTLGTLDRTLIVVVGDHGIRTRLEHPNFVAGTLDEISFHVPFLISAPGILAAPYPIPWVTSHIDVSPTLADLLSLTGERSLEMGSPVSEPALQQRTTYFFARNYLGADGYYENDSVHMFKYPIQSSFSARWEGALRFRTEHMLPAGSTPAGEIAGRLDRMTALQDRWSHFMLPEHYQQVFPTTQAAARREAKKLPRD